MFFEQYSHEPNIATARFWLRHVERLDELRQRLLEQKREQGHAALAVMEGHLRERAYFVGGRYTVADIALYAYTHVAPQGGFDLAPYPAVRAWLERVRAEPEHVPMLPAEPGP
jgi:glutathione S-transferase